MNIFRTSIAALIVMAAPVQTLAAQVVALPTAPKTRTVWVSGAGALFDIQAFHAGSDGSYWSFGNAVQLRGAAEVSLRRDIAVGIAGTYASMPVTTLGGACDGCRGDATVWQALATARLGGGGGIGFHTVLEGVAGVTGFGDVSPDAGGTSAVSAEKSMSPTIGVSYGAGYTVTPRFEVSFTQEIGLIFGGESAAAPANASTRPRYNATRLTIRYGVGR